MMTKKIAPSLLSADFSRLKEEIELAEAAGAQLLHLDVMDGHFVPNITIGPFIVKAIRGCTQLPLDCHLMIENPDKYVEDFVKAGANMISFHIEVVPNPTELIKKMKALNVKVGIALNPNCDLSKIESVLAQIDYVLVMSVFPGFGGQTFIEDSLVKIEKLTKLRAQKKLSFEIEVDGGIKVDNISSVSKAGADILVAGSAIFKSKNYKETINQMKENILNG